MENFAYRYGETTCQNKKKDCSNKAYYAKKDGEEWIYLCGTHLRKKEERHELPKIPEDEKKKLLEEKLKKEKSLIRKAQRKNKREGKKGELILYRLRMMKDAENISSFWRIYPNYKHQNKKDGFGCMSLSPKFLGPVKHGQPNLPIALNIENYHQSGKVFQEEVDNEGNPAELFYKNRLSFYQDKVPHRHKYKGTGTNKNIPLYFIWVDKEGKEHKLSYVESRQFYCTFYERLASQQKDFEKLLKYHKSGRNLQICGYDGFPIGNQTIEEAYLDSSVPFGHERVLYTMLLLHDTPEEFPWRKHKTFEF